MENNLLKYTKESGLKLSTLQSIRKIAYSGGVITLDDLKEAYRYYYLKTDISLCGLAKTDKEFKKYERNFKKLQIVREYASENYGEYLDFGNTFYPFGRE